MRYLFCAFALLLSACGTPGITTPLEELPAGMLLGRCTDFEVELDGYFTDSGGSGTGCQCVGNDRDLLLAMQARQCPGVDQ